MTNVIAYIKALIAKVRFGNLDSILSHFDKVVSKLEGFVTLEQEALAKTHAAIASLNKLRDESNAKIDKAYRTIHNISSLSA